MCYISIYVIKNKINNKVYVGQTSSTIYERFKHHKNDSKYESRGCPKLMRAMRKHNSDNFWIEVITFVHTQEVADYWEDFFILKYNSIKNGYNAKRGGHNGGHTQETKEKLSKIRTGDKNPMYGTIAPNRGIAHTQSTKNKIGNANKGMKRSVEVKALLSIVQKEAQSKRRKLSEEQIKKVEAEFKKDSFNIKNISDQYNVSVQTIYRIKDNLINRYPEIKIGQSKGKLSKIDIISIIEKLNSGKFTQKEIAKEYEVSPAIIYKILKKGDYYVGRN